MKKLIGILGVVALTYGAWRLWHGSEHVADGGKGQELFYGRAWLDHEPTSRTDRFHVFGTSRATPFGWFAERAMWKGEWERFRYEPRGDGQVELFLPHESRTIRLSYRAWRCNENGFEYCLELSGVKGPSKYYSRRGWEKRDLDDPSQLDAFLPSP